jgi:hypothetical protein
MPERLVLNTVGIKSPLDVRPNNRPMQSARRVQRAGRPAKSPANLVRSRTAQTTARRSLTPTPVISGVQDRLTVAPKLTSVALDIDLATQLDATARSAGVPANGLAVAALDAGLSTRRDDARRLLAHGGQGAPTHRKTQRTLSLPERLRVRADELSRTATGRTARAARSDLINAALREGLPDTPQLALALVIVAATSAAAAAA